MFRWGKKERDQKNSVPGQKTRRIPTVKFNSAKVTETVKADLRQNIRSLRDISANHFDMVYDAALRSISAGGDLHVLYEALMSIERMDRRRAVDVSRSLNKKATALIHAEDQNRLGIKNAIWLHSGAPCGGPELDAAHKAANGKPYAVDKGMLINGQWTWPGYQDGCNCISKSMIIGFEGYAGGKPKGVIE